MSPAFKVMIVPCHALALGWVLLALLLWLPVKSTPSTYRTQSSYLYLLRRLDFLLFDYFTSDTSGLSEHRVKSHHGLQHLGHPHKPKLRETSRLARLHVATHQNNTQQQPHQHLSNPDTTIYGELIRTLFKLLPRTIQDVSARGRNANESRKKSLMDILSSAKQACNDSAWTFFMGQLLGSMNVGSIPFNSTTTQYHHINLVRRYHHHRSSLSEVEKSLRRMTLPRGKTRVHLPVRVVQTASTSEVISSQLYTKYLMDNLRYRFSQVNKLSPISNLSLVNHGVPMPLRKTMKTKNRRLSHKQGLRSKRIPVSGPETLRQDSINVSPYPLLTAPSSDTSARKRARRSLRLRKHETTRSQVRRHVKANKKSDNDVPVPRDRYAYYDDDLYRDYLEPQRVSLSFVVHVSTDRGYEKELQSALAKALGTLEFKLLRTYVKPLGNFVKLKDGSPRDILQAFCNDILVSNTTAVFHLVNPFYHSRSWSSAQYVSNLLSTLDMPVISWGPEYIGTTDKVKEIIVPNFSNIARSKIGRGRNHMFKRFNRREPDNLQLNISPTLHHQAAAMLNVLRHYNWTDFSLVYTSDTGHDAFITAIRLLVQDLNRQSGRKGFKFNIIDELLITNTTDVSAIHADLKKLYKSDARIILLYCIEMDTIKILDAAKSLRLMTDEYLWFLTFEAINKNRLLVANNLPVGVLGVFYEYGEMEMKQAIEIAVNVWLRALQQSVQTSVLSSGIFTGLPWDIANLKCHSKNSLQWRDGPKFFEYLKNVSFDTVQFNEHGQLIYRDIYIVNVQPPVADEENQKWIQVGLYTPEGVQMQHITWPNGARTPPSGKPKRHFLQIVTREEPPFVEYRDLSQNGSCGHSSYLCYVYERDSNKVRVSESSVQKCCTGLSIELLHRLSVALNFDFCLYEVEDFQWGTKNADGTWNGIVGDLMNGKADMAVSSMTIDEDRSTVINFSLPYMETGITFIVAIREGAISATAFLEPYDLPSWCLILVCSVHVTGTSIFLFEWFSPYGLDHGRKLSSKQKFSLFRTFWLMWAMLFGAAVTTDSPRGVSSKFMSNIWALFALVFSASYTANLAAFMITKEEYYDLSGMQDWRLQKPQSMSPPFRFATIVNASTENNIKKHNMTMYQYMKQFTQTSVEDAMEALKANKLHAFIYDASVLKYQEGKDKDCRLITVGNWFATTGYGVGFPVGSPWLERVNSVILNLQYEGEMERLKDFWLTGACHMKRKKSNNSRGIGNGVSSSTLGILNFTSAFILLAAGTGLAVLTLVLEHFYFCFARKKLRSWDKKGCCALVSLSMGMSLRFQTSDFSPKQSKEKCKSPLCESKLWKAQYELKQARHEIQKLQSELARLTLEGNNHNWYYESICTADVDRAHSPVARHKQSRRESREISSCRKDRRRLDEGAVRVTLL